MTTEAITSRDEPAGLVASSDQSPIIALFRQAIDKGADAAAAMETLYKLYAAERDHSSRLAFSRALTQFQSSCPPVPRTSKADILTKSGTKFSYAYADFEQIVETITPHLRDNGLSFSFDSACEADRLTCICTLRHVEGHCEQTAFSLPTASLSAMSLQQQVGAALTFAKRQSLVAILGLALTDPDPDAASDPTVLNQEQVADLSSLISEVNANMAKFLAYAGVSRLEEIRQADLNRLVIALRQRGRQQGGAR